MKKLILMILLTVSAKIAYTAPLTAVSYISYNSQRAHALAILLEQHSTEILKKHGFETIGPGQISKELEKNACLEETCMLRFASNAEIDLLLTGSIEDRGDYVSVTLKSFGINRPFDGRLLLSRTVNIPATGRIAAREFSLICEENAALFIASTLRSFLYMVPVVKKESGLFTDPVISGRYEVYTTGSAGGIQQSGECMITHGAVQQGAADITVGSFILMDFSQKAGEIEEYYADRKREIVFEKGSVYDTLFIMLTTPVASATMPFAAPVLGYYTFGDWSGLGLWAVNVWPYLYIEARGFLKSPEKLKDDRLDITRDDRAANSFAWYMLLAGGMPLFMDAYAHQYLGQASLFTGRQKFLGSNLTAGYLALVSNGGGQFYKGHRGWGYFYFHLNNALLYMTLRESACPEYYDESSGAYTKGKRNTGRAMAYGSILAVSKIIEITHTLMAGTDIRSGHTVEEYIIPQPLFTLDSSGGPFFGVCMTLRY